jgi:hypothetical protein
VAVAIGFGGKECLLDAATFRMGSEFLRLALVVREIGSGDRLKEAVRAAYAAGLCPICKKGHAGPLKHCTAVSVVCYMGETKLEEASQERFLTDTYSRSVYSVRYRPETSRGSAPVCPRCDRKASYYRLLGNAAMAVGILAVALVVVLAVAVVICGAIDKGVYEALFEGKATPDNPVGVELGKWAFLHRSLLLGMFAAAALGFVLAVAVGIATGKWCAEAAQVILAASGLERFPEYRPGDEDKGACTHGWIVRNSAGAIICQVNPRWTIDAARTVRDLCNMRDYH